MHSQLGAKSKGQEEAKSVFPSTIKTIPFNIINGLYAFLLFIVDAVLINFNDSTHI